MAYVRTGYKILKDNDRDIVSNYFDECKTARIPIPRKLKTKLDALAANSSEGSPEGAALGELPDGPEVGLGFSADEPADAAASAAA